MEISRTQSLELLEDWKRRGELLGITFAARGGTAGGTMKTRIGEILSARRE